MRRSTKDGPFADRRGGARDVGAPGGWYATLEGAIVAGSLSRGEVELAVEGLVPEDRRDLVHYYQAKRR